jgi:pimeloyl-ACP methyl ester carboxylesterase
MKTTYPSANFGNLAREEGSGRATGFRKTFLAAGRLLARIAALIFCAPVILLPVATAVPGWIWAPLAVLDVVALAWLLRPGRNGESMNLAVAGIFLTGLLAVYASHVFAMTPPIIDADGDPIPGSIAVLEKVTLNGSEQWVSIRGKDMDNPVLLFLAGGPGGSQLVTARRALGGLEEDFVVVNWEQPGAGKSYHAVDRAALTPERYIADGIALAEHLRERFGEEKIYILGESWGSALGIWMVQRSPELFHAFIGTGQMVAFLETDLICYEFVLDLARERGDAALVEKLERQGPPPYYDGVAMKEAAYLLETYSYMNADPRIASDGFNTFQDLAGPEYGLYDKLAWFLGPLFTLDVVYPQLWDVDLRTQAAVLDVPVYFLLGRHDVNAPPVLAEEYFALLDAPHKELIWFDRSGHNPWVTESAAFADAIVTKILVEYPK